VRRIASVMVFCAGAAVVALAAQHGEAAHGGGTDNTTLWKLLNFGLLVLAAGYIIYKKAGGFFAARSSEIRRGLTEAAKVKADAETRYAEMERRLNALGAEVEALRKQAREESAAERARAQAEIERDLKRIQAQAEQEISAAAKSARQRLRTYSAELAVELAAAKIRQRLTPDKDKAIVESMVEEIGDRFAGQAMRAS
jgi:F-type H+-transporting ATPase subunit b